MPFCDTCECDTAVSVTKRRTPFVAKDVGEQYYPSGPSVLNVLRGEADLKEYVTGAGSKGSGSKGDE